VLRAMSSVPPRGVTGGWRARTQEVKRSSAARADEDEARRRQGRLEWDGAYGGEHWSLLVVACVDAWPDEQVRAFRPRRLALDAPLNTYPVARQASGAYSLESGPPATRRRQASNSTWTCCGGAPEATLLLPRGETMPCLMAGKCAKPGGSWQRASRFPPGARCHEPRASFVGGPLAGSVLAGRGVGVSRDAEVLLHNCGNLCGGHNSGRADPRRNARGA
jgi:hypothetical protein